VTIYDGPRGHGYRRYWLAIAALLALVISALATDYYGLAP
jgi:hypothetical protein